MTPKKKKAEAAKLTLEYYDWLNWFTAKQLGWL